MKSLYLRILHWFIGAREMRFDGGVLRFTRKGDAEIEFDSPPSYHMGDSVTVFMPGDKRSFARPIHFRVVGIADNKDDGVRYTAVRKAV